MRDKAITVIDEESARFLRATVPSFGAMIKSAAEARRTSRG